jgi:hypothetical protein
MRGKLPSHSVTLAIKPEVFASVSPGLAIFFASGEKLIKFVGGHYDTPLEFVGHWSKKKK